MKIAVVGNGMVGDAIRSKWGELGRDVKIGSRSVGAANPCVGLFAISEHMNSMWCAVAIPSRGPESGATGRG